jgi:hypothetical protein
MSKLGALLSNIKVVAQEAPAKKPGGGGIRREWNPSAGLTLRLWFSGAVYPSQELVDKFSLEYCPRLTEGDEKEIEAGTLEKPFMGNGFDVADSVDYPTFQTGGNRLLIISTVEKDAEGGRVDLFASVGYNEDNTPKLKVMDQGLVTFGKDFLIPKIEEVYGITFMKPAIPASEAKPAVAEVLDEAGKVVTSARAAVEAKPEVPAIEGVEYVDLVLIGQTGENSEPWIVPVTFLPKRVSRGEKKGETTVVRRENPKMFILYPKSLMEEETTQAAPEAIPAVIAS